MKKISLIFLFTSFAVIVYFFIREQFKGVVLTTIENTILSITYLIMGISLLILFRIKSIENKKQENSKK